MNLFKRKKSCSCGCNCSQQTEQNVPLKKDEKGIKVLGSGCAKCEQLEKNVKVALDQLGLNLKIEHITDFAQIATYGVMTTPALVIDGIVASYGKVLTVEEIKQIISEKR